MDESQILDEFSKWLDDKEQSTVEEFVKDRRYPEWLQGDKLRNLLIRELDWRHAKGRPIDEKEYQLRFPDQQKFVRSALNEFQNRLRDLEFQNHDQDLAVLLASMGRYSLIRKLGSGGFGEVWLAKDSMSNEVAIKIPHRGKMRIEQLKKEAEKLSLLEVDGVPRLHDSFEITLRGQQTVCMVFQYIHGSTLKEKYESQEKTSLWPDYDWIADVMAKTASILQHVHAKLIWHWDLNPKNILIDDNGKVWIIDFGLAIEDAERTELERGQIAGTVNYMSPEQARSDLAVLNGLSDIWSLGATLYELLTGRPVVKGSEKEALDILADKFTPAPAQMTNSKVPGELNRICSKCLQPEPTMRYQSAEELKKDLRSWKSGRPPLLVAPFAATTASGLQQAWRQRLGNRGELPEPFSVELNSIPLKLALIPPGHYRRGSPANQGWDDQHPQHFVQICRPFLLGETCVTQKQWFDVMQTTPWLEKKNVASGDHHPAVFITWNAAKEFCKKLSEKTRRTWRLPTEAEWEYACRAGTDTLYYFGDDPVLLDDHAWWGGVNAAFTPQGNCFKDKFAHQTGQKIPNAFGLHDMHGNNWEWCEDDYAPDAYGQFESVQAIDPLYKSDADKKVTRGGSWRDTPSKLHSAHRYGLSRDNADAAVGFRVVLNLL